MKKKIADIVAKILYACGWASAIFVGGYCLLVRPVMRLIMNLSAGTLTRGMLIIAIIEIFLSATVGGLCWTAFDLLAGIFRDIAHGREE